MYPSTVRLGARGGDPASQPEPACPAAVSSSRLITTDRSEKYSPNLIRRPKPTRLSTGHCVQLDSRIYNAVVTNVAEGENCLMLTFAWCHTEGTRRHRQQVTHQTMVIFKKLESPDGQDYIWEEVRRLDG